jgi:hypothetical protein
MIGCCENERPKPMIVDEDRFRSLNGLCNNHVTTPFKPFLIITTKIYQKYANLCLRLGNVLHFLKGIMYMRPIHYVITAHHKERFLLYLLKIWQL